MLAYYIGGYFKQCMELNSIKIGQYSLKEQSVTAIEHSNASSLDQYSLMEQSLCNEIL